MDNTITIQDGLEPINILLDELKIKRRIAFVHKDTGYFTLFKPNDAELSRYNIELTLSGSDKLIQYAVKVLNKRVENIKLLEKCYKL